MILSAEMRRTARGFRAMVTLAFALPPEGPKPPPPTEPVTVLTAGIRLDDGRHLLQLALHQLKGAGCIAADAPLQLAGILLREETLGNHNIEIDVKADGRAPAAAA